MLLLIGELVFTLYLVILNFSVCHLRVRFRLVSRMAHWILLLVFARLAIVELPHGAGRVLRLLSAPGTESSAGSARDPVGVSAIDNIAAVNRLAWYLVATLETHVLCFRKSDGILRALMDASLANDNSLKSWYGFSTTLGENTGVIAFRSALARSIVASTRDSELLACLHCTYRVFALRLFLAEIGLQQVAPTPMGSDAMAVIQGVSVKTVHRDSRWSAIRFAVIKQAMEVHVLYVSNRFTTSITFAGGVSSCPPLPAARH